MRVYRGASQVTGRGGMSRRQVKAQNARLRAQGLTDDAGRTRIGKRTPVPRPAPGKVSVTVATAEQISELRIAAARRGMTAVELCGRAAFDAGQRRSAT